MSKPYVLIKLETLEDAPFPQEEKYPSGSVVAKGYMFNHTKPTIGLPHYVHSTKISFHFVTTQVTEVEVTKTGYVFKTLNSRYEIKYVEEV